MALSRRLRGIRARVLSGYLLARIAKGDGEVQAVDADDLVTNRIMGSAIKHSADDFVQSIALAMPAEFSVAGSPVTGPGGTLTVTKANETANRVWAGPTSGAAAQPTFRALVAADMPGSGAGSGTVTSVALTAPVEFSVGGSPITTSGTLALSWATEAANKVLAGPTTGSAATPTFRSLVAADIPDLSGTYLPLHGTADAALKWATARTLSFTGDATGSGSVDGSASVATALTLAASGVTAATYGDATHVPVIAIDAKGRITSASNTSITQPLAANPTAQVAGSAVNGTAITFMRSDAAPKLADTAVTPGSYGDATHVGTFTVDQQGRLTAAGSISITQPLAANPTATASDAAVNGTAITFMRSDAAPAIQKGLSSQFGVVKVDGTSITSASGVLSVGDLSATYLPLAGGIMSGAIKASDGAAATPSVYWDTNSGFWNDTTNVGIGMSVSGVQIGWLNGVNPTLQTSGGGPLTFTVQGDSTTNFNIRRHSTNATGPVNGLRKARGTLAAPSVPATNDQLGIWNGGGYNGSTFTVGGQLTAVLTETGTVSSTAMGTRWTLSACPIGSGTLTEIVRWENETGVSMFGANPVIDQNRVFRPRAYTVATVPAVTSTGLVQVTDEGGGQCIAYADGTNWRRTSDLQVLTASTPTSRGLLGRMTTRVAYVNQDIVQRTYQKLSAAGLLTKLLGLWVFAGAPGSQADALRNWITLGTRDLTIIGSPTWSQTGGFTGDGSTAQLSTGATVTAFGASQDSFTVGCYVLAASASAAAVIGQAGASAARDFYMQSRGSGAITARCMDATNDTFTPSYYTGMFTLSRVLSTGYNASLDDLAAAAITRTSVNGVTRTLAFLGTADTTSNEFSTAQIAFAFIGNGLTATDIANLRAIMVDYYLVQTGVLSSMYLVGRLPGATAATEGQRLMVSDASVTASGNFGATLTGGGTNHVPAYYESGTPAWRIG